MKKYFLHDGTESSGPFDIEELKAKRITKTTPVWFEGMEQWKTAEAIPELARIFVVIPPPFIPKPKLNEKRKSGDRKILGLSINNFFIVLTLIALTVGTIIFNKFQDDRSRDLALKNHKTEVENYQFELRQKEIDKQNAIVAEQQKKDAERLVQEKKDADNNRLLEIENLLAISQVNIKNAEQKLNEASSFKLLRTSLEKKVQMDLLQRNIDSIKSGMVALKNESNQLKLELEKIE